MNNHMAYRYLSVEGHEIGSVEVKCYAYSLDDQSHFYTLASTDPPLNTNTNGVLR
jgi:hypothetical protein